MTKELLQLALDALELQPRVQTIDGHAYSHTVARDVAIHRLKQALAQQEQPASVDAYNGAREDVAIWKKRALEAEELNRKFIAELNGPTYLGEPAQPAQEASATWTEMVAVNLVREGVNKHRARELAAHFLTLPTQPALTYSDLEACREVAGKTFRHHKSSVKGQQVCEADDYEWHLAKAIEAHCRGGANHG